jgi:hypothetical protein
MNHHRKLLDPISISLFTIPRHWARFELYLFKFISRSVTIQSKWLSGTNME